MSNARTLRVWDPVVRLIHWSLVACVVLAWVTLDWFVGWHQPIGWIALGLVVVRIVWGFVGPHPARWAGFVRGPRAVAGYVRALMSGHAPRFVGHNPLGALMVLALCACVVGLALTGWLYTTDRFWGDETVEGIHEALAWTLVGLAIAHVIGVIFASRHQRENLVIAMIDGKKRAASDDDIA